MESDHILLAIIVVVITSCIVYDKVYLESLKDVHEITLNEQASVSSTRKIGESAIYRSLDVMHGLPLTVGLQVRYDIYKIRNGNLKDIWKLAMRHPTNQIVFPKKDPVSNQELNVLFHKISTVLAKVAPEGGTIGIHAPFAEFETFVVLLGCFFYTKNPVVNLTKIPQVKDENVELICCHSGEVVAFAKLGYSKFLVLDEGEVCSLSKGEIIRISEVLESSVTLEDSSKFDYNYVKDDDLQKVFIDTLNFKETEYSQVQFVSAVASQVRSLPMEHMWDSSDSLMIEVPAQSTSVSSVLLSNQNVLVKLLSGFIQGVQRITMVSSNEIDLQAISDIAPSILSINEQTLANKIVPELAEIIDTSSLIQSQLLKLSSKWFSRGIHNNLFKHNQVPKIRVLYPEIYAKPLISSLELNYIQSCFSCRIVTERFKLPLFGPVFKTNFFDYRVFDEDTEQGKLKYRKLGVPANCLELKVKDLKNYEAANNEGEILGRGFNIGKVIENRVQDESGDEKDQEGWMPFGIVGKFGEDGCFYEYL